MASRSQCLQHGSARARFLRGSRPLGGARGPVPPPPLLPARARGGQAPWRTRRCACAPLPGPGRSAPGALPAGAPLPHRAPQSCAAAAPPLRRAAAVTCSTASPPLGGGTGATACAALLLERPAASLQWGSGFCTSIKGSKLTGSRWRRCQFGGAHRTRSPRARAGARPFGRASKSKSTSAGSSERVGAAGEGMGGVRGAGAAERRRRGGGEWWARRVAPVGSARATRPAGPRAPCA